MTTPGSKRKVPKNREGYRPTRDVPRVLFVEPNDDGTVGGSHQVLFDFARHLDRRRYEPVAVFYQDNVFVDLLREAGVEVHLLTGEWERERSVMRTGRRLLQGRMLVEAVARRVRFLRRHEISILHVNGTPQTGHDDWLPAATLLGLPTIANCAGNVRFGIRSFLQRACMRWFDYVLPVSNHVAQQVIDFGYAAERVSTIHPGIDIEHFRSRVRRAPESVREELGVHADVMLILMVGNLRPWKGQHIAIKAISGLSPTARSAVQLVIVGATAVGEEDYERHLRTLVSEAGLERQIRFLGHRSDVPDLIAASDVVLHASVEPEPFGLVVVEGLALGKAVIASHLGGPAEILGEDSELTFSPTDPPELTRHLEMLLENPDRLAALGEAGRVRASMFEIANTVSATTRIYDKLLGRR